jgi:hypothetical protein
MGPYQGQCRESSYTTAPRCTKKGPDRQTTLHSSSLETCASPALCALQRLTLGCPGESGRVVVGAELGQQSRERNLQENMQGRRMRRPGRRHIEVVAAQNGGQLAKWSSHVDGMDLHCGKPQVKRTAQHGTIEQGDPPPPGPPLTHAKHSSGAMLSISPLAKVAHTLCSHAALGTPIQTHVPPQFSNKNTD